MTARLLLVRAILATGALLIGWGCTAVEQTKNLPGTDRRLLEPGTEQSAIAAAMGPALRIWRPNDTVSYELHAFRNPLKGSGPDAAAMVFLDLATAGAWEAFAAIEPRTTARESSQKYTLIWIGFDVDGRVCGAYREFDILPATPPQRDRTDSPNQRESGTGKSKGTHTAIDSDST